MWEQVLLSNIPSIGVGGIVLGLLIYFMRNANVDRSAYETQLKNIQDRHDQELTRVRQNYTDEISDLRKRVDELETRLERYREDLGREREERWVAEQNVIRLRTELESLR